MIPVELPIPRDWQIFEDFCRDLFAAEWEDPETQKHGRSGQKQRGVDVFGRRDGLWQGVQCKRKRGSSESRLKEDEIRAEVDMACGFKPPLQTLVIATTAPPDAETQTLAARITSEHGEGGLRVVVFGWSELCERLQSHPRLFRRWQRRLMGGQIRYWNVPHLKNPYFTGRDEDLDALKEDLQRTGVVVLRGLGGVGKTQTAVEYAYRYRDDYDAILWTRATKAELLAGLKDIAVVLNLPEKDARDQEMAAGAVRVWLEGSEDENPQPSPKFPWLLVLDNANEPDVIAPWFPSGPPGHILLTSRSRQFGALGIQAVRRLDTWPQDKGVSFLLQRTDLEDVSSAERQAAVELVQALGLLPLALEQASAFITAKQVQIADYLKSFHARRLELLDSPETGGYNESVVTTWEMNFRQVEKRSKESADVLRLSAFLAPDRIPLEILVDGAPELGPVLSPFLAEATADPVKLGELLEPLTQFSLIEYSREDRSFSIHQLVQEVMKGRISHERVRVWEERCVRVLHRVFPPVEIDSWPLCERLEAHVRALTREKLEPFLQFEEAGVLFSDVARYLHIRGRYREALPLYEQALSIREKVLGAEHSDVAESLHNLARLHRILGQYAEAAPLHEQALQIRKKVLGAKHPDVATSLDDLASLYRAQGAHARAAPLYERALAIRETVFGPHHPAVAASLSNLGNLHRAEGDRDLAESLLVRALGILERELGKEHPEIAVALTHLARLYRDQGAYAQAAPRYERALEIREKRLRPDHPHVARSLSRLANLYYVQGNRAHAKRLYGRALRIQERVLGREHPDVAVSLNNLGNIYSEQGSEGDAALPFYERALLIRMKTLGKEHPDVARSLRSLAVFHADRAHYERAIALFEQALEIQRKALGGEHIGVAQNSYSLANLYSDQGMYSRAASAYEEALRIWREVLGPEHPSVGMVLSSYSALLRTMGRQAEASGMEAEARAKKVT